MKPTKGNGPTAGNSGAVKDQSTQTNFTDNTDAWPALQPGAAWMRDARQKSELIELINAKTATDDLGAWQVRWYELTGPQKGRVGAVVQLGRDADGRNWACVVIFTNYRPTLQVDAVKLMGTADNLWQSTASVREAFESLLDMQAKSARRLTDKQCGSYDNAEYRWDRLHNALMQVIECPSNHVGIPADAELEALVYDTDRVEVML